MRVIEQHMIDDEYLEKVPEAREGIIECMHMKSAQYIYKKKHIPIIEYTYRGYQPQTKFTLDYTIYPTENIKMVRALLYSLSRGLDESGKLIMKDIVTYLNK